MSQVPKNDPSASLSVGMLRQRQSFWMYVSKDGYCLAILTSLPLRKNNHRKQKDGKRERNQVLA
jgi:hypothetical protein